MRVISRDDKTVSLGLGEKSKAVLTLKTLRIDFFSGDNIVFSTNARGIMNVKHLSHKKGSAEAVN